MSRRLAGLVGALALVGLIAVVVFALSADPERVGWPELVSPALSDRTGTLAVSGGERSLPPGEETQPFVRATDASGRVVLHQPFAWPRTEEKLPVGAYTITVYERSCEEDCSTLAPDDSSRRCQVDLELGYHDDRRQVNVTWSGTQLVCQVVRPF